MSDALHLLAFGLVALGTVLAGLAIRMVTDARC